MEWFKNQNTVNFIRKHLPSEFKEWEEPDDQDEGRGFNAKTWESRVLSSENLMKYDKSSPENIIAAIKNNQFLEALVLTVLWGTMGRQMNKIYTQDLHRIQAVLSDCRMLIEQSNAINDAWNLLQIELEWSNVMTSKILHFMCKALGHESDPPVPIDNKVILEKVWPAFIKGIPKNERPGTWANCLSGYLRYMTFINALREIHYPGWTNTEIESTLFTRYYPKQ